MTCSRPGAPKQCTSAFNGTFSHSVKFGPNMCKACSLLMHVHVHDAGFICKSATAERAAINALASQAFGHAVADVPALLNI